MEESFSSPVAVYQNVKLEKIDGFLVACAAAKETGLPYDILLDSVGAIKEDPGCPRIGVVVGDIVIPVSISEEPVILSGDSFEGSAQIFSWVSRHHIPLKMHWNKALTDREMLMIAENDKK